ncbi:MAG: hypothetical protein H7Y04_07960 [Verrucomicrobia bacterium]|nr:hypothetical protein [Cytophagales bacterium]
MQADTTKVVKNEPVAEKKADVPAEKPATITVPAGLDPASLPVSSQTLGAFPYVSFIDGYEKMDRTNQKAAQV